MGDIGSIWHQSLLTSTRSLYQLLRIQIYASVLENGWVKLDPLSIKGSERGVYQLLQIDTYVGILQNWIGDII